MTLKCRRESSPFLYFPWSTAETIAVCRGNHTKYTNERICQACGVCHSWWSIWWCDREQAHSCTEEKSKIWIDISWGWWVRVQKCDWSMGLIMSLLDLKWWRKVNFDRYFLWVISPSWAWSKWFRKYLWSRFVSSRENMNLQRVSARSDWHRSQKTSRKVDQIYWWPLIPKAFAYALLELSIV